MFKWLIDRQIRAELAEMSSHLTKFNARLEVLETSFKSLKGKMYRSAARTSNPRAADIPLTPELRNWIQTLQPQEQALIMEKLKNSEDLELT